MIVVLDASAGIEIALVRKKSALLSAVLEKAAKVITSDLYKAETGNVIWKYYTAGLLKRDEAFRRLAYCDNLIDDYVDIAENNEEALIEGIRLNHSVYDLLYFTLARRKGATLMTLDKKFKKIAVKNGIEVI